MKRDLSFDAELLLHFLATHEDADHQELIVQMMPTAAVTLVTDQTTPDDKDWPEAINDLVQHYVDEAQERALTAMKELMERRFVSREEQKDEG